MGLGGYGRVREGGRGRERRGGEGGGGWSEARGREGEGQTFI